MNLIDEFPQAKAYTIHGNDQAILMIHGFTSTPNIFKPLAHKLSAVFGWEIKASLLPGHGTQSKHLDSVSAHDWFNFAEQEFESLLQRFPKIHLIGLSLGGTLCAHLVMKYPNNVSSLTLLAPAMAVRDFSSRLLLPLVRLLPNFILKKWIVRKKNLNTMEQISYHYYSVFAVTQFDLVCRKVRSIFQTKKPCLIFAPANDLTIHPKSSRWFLAHTSHPHSKLIVLENSPHVVFLGQDNEMIFSEIENFLRSLT